MEEIKGLCASGQLGYGIPKDSFARGIKARPDFIGADMGSIDPGPFCLGSGQMIARGMSLKRDLELVLQGARSLRVPLLMGSAGTAGGNSQLAQVCQAVQEVAAESGLHFRLAVIHAQVEPNFVKAKIQQGKVQPCGAGPDLTLAEVDRSTNIVGQMGLEPFMAALEMGADVVLAGRACDTAIFASMPVLKGFDRGLSIHMAKLLECSSAFAEPRGRDASMGYLRKDHFLVESMHPDKRCTPVSVAAHTLYEQPNPHVVYGPGGAVDFADTHYEAYSDRMVKVWGSRWVPADAYTIKLEGAASKGHRYIAMGGIRDPILINQIDVVTAEVRQTVREIFAGRIPPEDYNLKFRIYGKDGVMGGLEPTPVVTSHEIFLLIDVVGKTDEIARNVAAVAKQYFLHLRYTGILNTGGNVAHPFSPDILPAGEVYTFNMYHLVEVIDPLELFPIDLIEV